jgi:N-hydroxyarylamine O-acetyltransferase
MHDLDAYLARIGSGASADLTEVHRAHVTAIPFENLDPQRGVPVSLAPEDLERKLVGAQRGGYCFEQNVLLKSALEALGAEVEMLLARVRVGAAPGAPRPRTHLVLRVRAGGGDWHADVGFGHGTLIEPIPFGPGDAHEQFGWRFRVVQDGRELVLQTLHESQWVDLYGFEPTPVPLVDVELSNWFTCTHPRSRFVTGLIVSAQRADGTRESLSDWSELALIEETPAQRRVTPIERTALPELLAARFGLKGFRLRDDGHLVFADGHAVPEDRRPVLHDRETTRLRTG